MLTIPFTLTNSLRKTTLHLWDVGLVAMLNGHKVKTVQFVNQNLDSSQLNCSGQPFLGVQNRVVMSVFVLMGLFDPVGFSKRLYYFSCL